MKLLVCVLIIIIVFLVYGYVSNFRLENNDISIYGNFGLWDGARFVLLADLHGALFGKNNEKLIRMIQSENPDGILLVGDMIVKNGYGMGACVDLCRELVAISPVYYSLGNHEIRLEKKESFLNQLVQLGVHVLDNETIELNRMGLKLSITGLTLSMDYYQKFWRSIPLNVEDLNQLVGLPSKDSFHILMAHNPEYFKIYEQWGADLTVSGHLHGGIMILPFGGVIAPSLRLFPTYSHGVYHNHKATMILSRGLGLHHIKLRFFNRPEMITFVLQNK